MNKRNLEHWILKIQKGLLLSCYAILPEKSRRKNILLYSPSPHCTKEGSKPVPGRHNKLKSPKGQTKVFFRGKLRHLATVSQRIPRDLLLTNLK